MCPDNAQLTIVAGGLAVMGASLAGVVGHGVLRPMLEARGVTPWRVRDSLGSMPLVLLGSALVTGALTLSVLRWGAACGSAPSMAAAWWLGVVVALLVGALMIRLGLHALRKLH